MKTAIVTIFGLTNYGNRLQNYALQEVLKSFGCDVTTLITKERTNLLKQVVKIFLRKKNGRIVFKDRNSFFAEKKRRDQFCRFNEKYITCVMCTERSKQKLNAQYEMFVSGSDQIWNPFFWGKRFSNIKCDWFFLGFAEPNKRIAYAASFGIDSLPAEWKKPMAEYLAEFRAISVRESSGSSIVKLLIGQEVPVVIDPTILLTAEQWRNIQTDEPIQEKGYILAYFLGKPPEDTLSEIHEAAKKLHLEIIEIMDCNSPYYTSGPEDFITLIDRAAFVYTDSFHAVVFSILFHTSFRVFQRVHPKSIDMKDRIDTLLTKAGLTECALQHRIPTPEEFERADKLLEREREFSLNFLQEALSISGEEESE